MAHPFEIEVRGVRLRCAIDGAGPPLVVQAPGWGLGGGFYEESLAPLAAHATVITYDPRGSGGSTRPAAPGLLSVAEQAADLEALRAALGLERIALLAHAHGGSVALNFALAHPLRLDRLILVAPQLDWGAVGRDLQRALPRLAQRPATAEAARRYVAEEPASTDAGFADWLIATLPLMVHDPAKGARFAAWIAANPPDVRTSRAVTLSDPRFPVRDRLGEVIAPALVLAGRYDVLASPTQAETIARALPDARLRMFERSAHFPWIEEPAAFFPLVADFLRA